MVFEVGATGVLKGQYEILFHKKYILVLLKTSKEDSEIITSLRLFEHNMYIITEIWNNKIIVNNIKYAIDFFCRHYCDVARLT